MRNFWNQIPGLRIVLSVMVGIGIEIYADTQLHISREAVWLMLVLFGVSLLTGIIIHLVKNVSTLYRLRIVNGIVLSVFLISFGYILTWLNAEKNFKNHFQNFLARENFLLATIVKPPLEKEKIMTVVAEVQEVKSGTSTTATRGNILVSVLRDRTSENLKYGDVIVFSSKVEEFEEPKNPDEFSFKLYQSFHNIYHRAFLKPGDWKLMPVNEGNIFFATIYKMRDYFLSLITKYVKDKNDFAVASAIMLGYNDYMNGDITRAYASSGALHVLSVSGLHVGIMFIMLNFLLSWMDKRGRKFVIAKAIIIIILIWFYACLTGLSPSVLRSAMMFSMIQGGKAMIRNVNTFNVIATSALVLILYNPFIVTEVGFRLSYLAVIGIVYLHPKIYSLLVVWTPGEPRFKSQRWFLKPMYFLRYDLLWFFFFMVDLGWQIVAVSLAAQIATFSLSLLYFHQFPNLFLLSNLIVIPASNLILFTGTALLAVGEIPYINDVFGWSFNMLLVGLNKFIFLIDSLPYALIQGISINMYEMIAWYIFILLMCGVLYEKWGTKSVLASLIIVFGLASFNSYETIQKSEQKKIVVYAVPKQSAIAFIAGGEVNYDFDEALINNQSSMLFHVKHHWWDCGVKNESSVNSIQLPIGKLVLFEGKKILVIDSVLEKLNFEMEEKLKVELVILSHNPKVYLTNLRKVVDFDEVVFDSSNKPWRIDYWKKDCEQMKIRFWDVSEKGYYLRDLSKQASGISALL